MQGALNRVLHDTTDTYIALGTDYILRPFEQWLAVRMTNLMLSENKMTVYATPEVYQRRTLQITRYLTDPAVLTLTVSTDVFSCSSVTDDLDGVCGKRKLDAANCVSSSAIRLSASLKLRRVRMLATLPPPIVIELSGGGCVDGVRAFDAFPLYASTPASLPCHEGFRDS